MTIAVGTSQSSTHDAVHDACNNRSCQFGAIARAAEPDATELTETHPLARTAQPQRGQLGDATKQRPDHREVNRLNDNPQRLWTQPP